MTFGREFAEKLCHVLAASAITGITATAAPGLGVLALVEALLGSTALAHVYVRQRSETMDTKLRRLAEQIERGSDSLLAAEYGRDLDAPAMRDVAMQAIREALPLIVPRPSELVAERLTEERAPGFYLDRAAKERPVAFADRPENEIARRLLWDIVGNAYGLIVRQPEFRGEMLHRAVLDLLHGQDVVIGKVDSANEKLDQLLALFKSDPRVVGSRDENQVPLGVVNRFFVDVGTEVVEHPDAVAGAFEAHAEAFARLRDDLAARSNADPTIVRLREEALAALNAGEIEQAERLLAEIGRRQDALIARRRRAAEEAQADLQAGLLERAETCAGQAEAALLRRDVAAAATRSNEGLATLAEASSEIRWWYAGRVAAALESFGDRAGRNDALAAAIDLYRSALGYTPRERVPLDWATTQNNLGNALARLGRAGERDGAAGGGGGGLSRGAGGKDARAGAARLGDDAEQPRHRACEARRAGERDGAAGGGGGGLSRGAGGKDARAGAARLGDDAEQPRQRALERWASGRAGRRGWRRRWRPIARRWRKGRASGCRSTGRRRRTTSATRFETLGRAGERDGASGGGGGGLSRGAGGKDARAGAARLGDDAEQPRQRACERWASGRAGRRGWRRRWRPIARRWRKGRASGCRSTGR